MFCSLWRGFSHTKMFELHCRIHVDNLTISNCFLSFLHYFFTNERDNFLCSSEQNWKRWINMHALNTLRIERIFSSLENYGCLGGWEHSHWVFPTFNNMLLLVSLRISNLCLPLFMLYWFLDLKLVLKSNCFLSRMKLTRIQPDVIEHSRG